MTTIQQQHLQKNPERQSKKENPMVTQYRMEKIRALLTEGFSNRQLLNFCFDTPVFRLVYNQLSQNVGKDEIVGQILAHADRTLNVEPLLGWAKEHNPARYKEHQPYYDLTPSTVRILLVDDNKDWREQLGGLLRENGYEVVTAKSKEEAIHRFTSEQYNLAIIDMRLDEADKNNREGVALGFWLRKNGYDDLPIIIMSAYDMEAEIVKDMALRPFQFSPVEKGYIGSGDRKDLLHQIELAIK